MIMAGTVISVIIHVQMGIASENIFIPEIQSVNSGIWPTNPIISDTEQNSRKTKNSLPQSLFCGGNQGQYQNHVLRPTEATKIKSG